MNFERGLTNLELILKQSGVATVSSLYLDFLGWRRQLVGSIVEERRFAVLSPQEQEHRERVLRELDRLALRHAGKSFLDLCMEESLASQHDATSSKPQSGSGKQFQAAYALLVGVGSYIHLGLAHLPAAVRDAQALATVLTDPAYCGYPPANVRLLTEQQATARNIRTALLELAQAVTPEATVCIYFSGHGGRAPENGRWRAYLCPLEADPDNLVRTAVSGKEFSNLLSGIPARKLLVVLDACHAGGAADLRSSDGAVTWRAGLTDTYVRALARGTGRVVIASSRESQVSWNRPGNDHGLFTWHLLEGLQGAAAVRGDGLVHVLDLFAYVSDAVHRDRPDQEPILHAKDVDDNFPVALARIKTSPNL